MSDTANNCAETYPTFGMSLWVKEDFTYETTLSCWHFNSVSKLGRRNLAGGSARWRLGNRYRGRIAGQNWRIGLANPGLDRKRIDTLLRLASSNINSVLVCAFYV
ncbi:hypothetical protein O9929_08610 [Vibrio lentus]|nr:hypothetical protein [Vibrio lentus]